MAHHFILPLPSLLECDNNFSILPLITSFDVLSYLAQSSTIAAVTIECVPVHLFFRILFLTTARLLNLPPKYTEKAVESKIGNKQCLLYGAPLLRSVHCVTIHGHDRVNIPKS
ncbi:hypothetical protein PoB_000513000 [Plakobranchus ocellatus]|uniref:Uncharacterized protein n=1 Tax=Plakobranchus ocellatus TaxID=259542 RepID=A0AAV3Y801_9GAST|nr:hypothetical protein PoB_000513000 [Plakobranchus ocellatus]